MPQLIGGVDDRHGASAQDIGRAHEHRIANHLRHLQSFRHRARRAVVRHGNPDLLHERSEALPILREIHGVGRCTQNRHAGLNQPPDQLERRLAPKLDDDTLWLFEIDDVQNVLQRQRLKVQAIAGVIVCGDRLGIAVGHDRLIAQATKGERRLRTAIVELDPLADTIGTATQHQDLAPLCGLGLADGLVRAVQIRRERGKLCGTRVHPAIDWPHPVFQPLAPHSHLGLRWREQPPDQGIGHAILLGLAPEHWRHLFEPQPRQAIPEQAELVDLVQEPGIDGR